MEKKEKTGSFQVVDEAGISHTIIQYRIMVLIKPLGGPDEWIDNGRSFQTSTGHPVNPRRDGTFENVRTGQVLRRI